MYDKLRPEIIQEIEQIKDRGLYKQERIIDTPQGVEVIVNGKKVLNFCSNNYLGLANHPEVIVAAHDFLQKWGYGLSSVRFICGTQKIHKDLERSLSTFFSTEDTILYSSCFDANGGLFETLTNDQDAIFTDKLNHASLIDGIRLSKATRYVYEHIDMADLEAKLHSAPTARRKLIVTDGVFSMDGEIVDLPAICALAEKHDALVVVDDSHATGVLGKTGRGTPELHGVMDRVDIITSTLGKALGGALGGFATGRKEIIEFLRQRSRPYLFSNSLAPVIVGTTLHVLRMLSQDTILQEQLRENTTYAREGLVAAGLDIKLGIHPIIPVMLYDAPKAQKMAARLLELGVYVIGFFYPVVPMGQARIRVQISAAHTREQLDTMIAAFRQANEELG